MSEVQAEKLKMGAGFIQMMESQLEALKEDQFARTNVGVVNEGTKIVLPVGMSSKQGIECLQRKIKEEETMVAVHHEVDAFPLDGAYAFMKVLQNKYGWIEPVPTPGFFGDNPPNLVNLEIGYGKHTQIIWGDFRIPGIEGKLTTGASRGKFIMRGEVKQRHKEEVAQIADAVREYVRENSIYKGQAIRIGDGDPKFLDLSRVNPEELTFSDEVMEQVETNLFTPIEHTQACRDYRIPLKRGVLLEGKYGTGKTLTAYVAATKCVKNNWTFIYLSETAALGDAIEFAKRYSPAVIFAEDIDRAVAGERSVEMDDILNTIDGIGSKGSEIITILTSNHVEKINKAMLRPGRLDAVITVHAPDAKAAEKLMRIYARGLIADTEDLTEAGKELAGQIPAVIREVVERSKLHAIPRTAKGETLRLTGIDLTGAARGMKSHLAMLESPKDRPLTPVEAVGVNLAQLVAEAALNGRGAKIDEVHERVCQ